MIIGPKGHQDEMIPKLVETAKAHAFCFVWQEPNGRFRALANVKPNELLLKFLKDAIVDIQDPMGGN